jgi:hypothetical protein
VQLNSNARFGKHDGHLWVSCLFLTGAENGNGSGSRVVKENTRRPSVSATRDGFPASASIQSRARTAVTRVRKKLKVRLKLGCDSE